MQMVRVTRLLVSINVRPIRIPAIPLFSGCPVCVRRPEPPAGVPELKIVALSTGRIESYFYSTPANDSGQMPELFLPVRAPAEKSATSARKREVAVRQGFDLITSADQLLHRLAFGNQFHRSTILSAIPGVQRNS